MAKPICVIYVHHEVLRYPIRIEDINDGLTKKMPDYYVLCFPSFNDDAETLEIKVFYEKDFTEIQYQELKKIITDKLSEYVPTNIQ